MDGQYYIKGYLHTKSNFDINKDEKAGISIVSYSDTLKSYLCELSQISELVSLPNISSIELTKTVNPKIPKTR